MGDVGQAGDVALTLLDDNEGKDSQIGTDDATTDGLSLALSGATGAVARVALGEKKLDTGGQQHSLLHRETLLVVTTGDLEDVALKLVADGVTGNLLAHALVQEDADLLFIVDFDQLLGAVGGVAVVERERPSAGIVSFRFDQVNRRFFGRPQFPNSTFHNPLLNTTLKSSSSSHLANR
jgi:hypothetical protein